MFENATAGWSNAGKRVAHVTLLRCLMQVASARPIALSRMAGLVRGKLASSTCLATYALRSLLVVTPVLHV